MNINTFATLLTIGAIILLIFALSLYTRYNSKLSDRTLLYLITAISGGSVLCALIFEYIYNTPPCLMCWWSRIVLFPILPISLVALNYRVTNVGKIIITLTAIGLMFTAYHYYYHFNIYVLGNAFSMPCDASTILPTCSSNNGILVWGFITMPLMGFMNFLSITLLANKIKE